MKERLLGAAVLIAAAVLIIPAFLDGPRPPDTVSRDLQLPVPGEGAEASGDANRTHTVQIEAATGSSNMQTSGDAPIMPDSVPPAATVSGSSSTQNKPDPVVDTPAEPVKNATNSTPVKETQTQPVPAGTGWAVQVGSFSSESNARRLMEYLKGSGYPAFVTRNVVNGRVMFRVRVGPESDRARAEALIERLKSDRQQTQLVRHP